MKKENFRTNREGRVSDGFHSKSERPVKQNNEMIIADIQFLILLIGKYKMGFHPLIHEVLWLPVSFFRDFSSSMNTPFQSWLKNGNIRLLETSDEMVEMALESSVDKGLHFNERMALMAARKHRLSIISTSALINREADKLKIKVVSGEEFLNLYLGRIAI